MVQSQSSICLDLKNKVIEFIDTKNAYESVISVLNEEINNSEFSKRKNSLGNLDTKELNIEQKNKNEIKITITTKSLKKINECDTHRDKLNFKINGSAKDELKKTKSKLHQLNKDLDKSNLSLLQNVKKN